MKTKSLPQAKKIARCSSLPSMFSCAPSVLNPDKLTEVRVENGLEGLGTDIHAAIQHTIETGDINLRKIEKLYKDENIDRAKFLFHQGLRVVQDAKKEMKNMQFEVEVSFETEKYVVTGHVDVLDLLADCAYVIDFKTGRTRDDHYHQMAGYAIGAWTKMGRPDRYTVRVACVYLEGYPTEPPTIYEFDAGEMRAWLKELDALDQNRYTVNRRCVYCPLKTECKTFASYLNFATGVVAKAAGQGKPMPGSAIRNLSAEKRGMLNTALKTIDLAVKDVRARIKEEVLANGEMDMGNGNKYVIRLRGQRHLLTARALEVAKKYVTPKALTDAMSLSMTDLLSAAAGRVRSGQKGIVRAEFEKALVQAGAVVTSESPYLETENANKGSKWPKKKK